MSIVVVMTPIIAMKIADEIKKNILELDVVLPCIKS